jgi:hypothetical protein
MGRPVRRDVAGTEVFGTYANSNAGIRCEAYFASNQTDVYILKQVGSRRYKVVDSSAVQDESLVVGSQYVISVLDTTDWHQVGAPVKYAVGTLFTCSAECADPQNGVALAVKTAKLVSGTPSANGEMRIVGYTTSGHATPIALRNLKKRTATDWNGNVYTWVLVNDSTADYILLTPVTGNQ